MEKISLDLVRLQGDLQGGYRVLATCGDECINFETRSEDAAHEVYYLAEKALSIYAQVIEGISENSGEPVAMIDFDYGETRLLPVHKRDVTGAAAFLSLIIEWTQPDWTQEE